MHVLLYILYYVKRHAGNPLWNCRQFIASGRVRHAYLTSRFTGTSDDLLLPSRESTATDRPTSMAARIIEPITIGSMSKKLDEVTHLRLLRPHA